MYSRLPAAQCDWSEETTKYVMCFFPWIGIVIGALCLGWDFLAGYCQMRDPLRNVVLMLIPIAVSGGIHLDGFLDTADALSSWRPREKRLEILKDSHAGAFAIIIGITYFVLAFGVYSEMTEERLRVLVFSFMLSRAFSGLGMVSLKKARNSGLLYTFADAAANRKVGIVMGAYILVTTGILLWMDLLRGAVIAGLALLAFLWYRHMSYSKFGGITGDLAGCFLQTAELLMALGVIMI